MRFCQIENNNLTRKFKLSLSTFDGSDKCPLNVHSDVAPPRGPGGKQKFATPSSISYYVCNIKLVKGMTGANARAHRFGRAGGRARANNRAVVCYLTRGPVIHARPSGPPKREEAYGCPFTKKKKKNEEEKMKKRETPGATIIEIRLQNRELGRVAPALCKTGTVRLRRLM
ncbi:hypothetical protein EVAR_40553_1 [Eumeta japonica]|uniref:Uncharacterized protein n=1 Tax=Eumeta variegata TaxID=151549 RepID=A0A4C1VWF7_EUMVA|nr:hypothetical protein EVAR_40553_1 [Eumeta japonica]